jgi:TolA-binding protein
LLVAALVFLPAAALAATWVVLRAPSVEHSNGGADGQKPAHRAAAAENEARGPVEGTLPVPLAARSENGQGLSRGASDSTPGGPRTLQVSRTRGATRGAVQDSDASTLAAENALMQTAMVAARAGDDARAVASFGDLLARYPRSPLAENAGVERFRALGRLRGEGAAASSDAPRR